MSLIKRRQKAASSQNRKLHVAKEPTLPLSHTIDAWRVFRILSEFVEGFEAMMSLGPSVAIFGSAKTKPHAKEYKQAAKLAGMLAKEGFGIITGGGPGIMEAANRGAQLSKGKSAGLCIDLPTEEEPNQYIDRKFLLRFRYFFVRRVMFVRYAQAFVVFPGGFGTLDELFEALILIQTMRIKPFPVFLVGKEYWAGLLDWMKKTVVKEKNLSSADLKLLTVTDDLDLVLHQTLTSFKKVKTLENF
jgi:uncharacterized protein (TIGR00730 family)